MRTHFSQVIVNDYADIEYCIVYSCVSSVVEEKFRHFSGIMSNSMYFLKEMRLTK